MSAATATRPRLTNRRLADFQKILLRAREERVSNSKGIRRRMGQSGGPDVGDETDQVQRETDTATATGLMGQNDDIVNGIDAALERLALGTYGICAGCELAIPDMRLLRIPWATKCTPCQQESEDRAKFEEARAKAPGRPTRYSRR